MTDFSTITACGECCTECPKKKDGRCPGCIEADGRVPEWAASGRCRVHACTREHGVQFCGLCREFPCEKLPELISWNPAAVEKMIALRDEYKAGEPDAAGGTTDHCIFCGIVSGGIPGMKIYEDEKTIAFLDAAKDVDGHILVVPKKHCRGLLDCDTETLAAVMRTVKTVSVHLTAECGYEGVNLLHASEECAGQSVPHFHIHIIPRKKNDGIDAWPHFGGAKQDVRSVFERLKMD